MDLTSWMADYEAYLKSNGYASRTSGLRLRHLRRLKGFVEAKGYKTLEEFRPEHVRDFISHWVRHQPWARKSSGFKRKSRFRPRHHIGIQYSLHCFFRWAHSTGRLQRNIFPRKPSVRGHYFFPEVAGYLRFCQEHKGLVENSLLQIELFVRRFDHFLQDCRVKDWNRLKIRHIDLFVRQQASRNPLRIQRIHKVLRGLFRYLLSLGRADRDWAAALHSPRRYRLARTPRAVTAEQVLGILRSIDRGRRGGRRDFAIILMAASLGVRASEIAALELEKLDWRHAVVSFPAIKGRNELRMPLSRPLTEALVDYLRNDRPAGSHCRNVFLRLDPPFAPLTSRSVSSLIARSMRRAGVGGSGHQLRHAFASELLRSGVSFSTLQELLGHSHMASTQIYTKIDLAQLRDVADNDAEGL